MSTFPFGAPSTRRPPRRPTSATANAFVLGVYPSAFHVRWTAPEWAVASLTRRSVSALAVDVEPAVFWDGIRPRPEEVLAAWMSVRFVEGDGPKRHGHVSLPIGLNGSSGLAVAREVLEPTGRTLDDAWITDAIDTFYVKTGEGQQGAAIADVYNPFAALADLPAANLPGRPSARDLVRLAATEHRDRLSREWHEAAPEVLFTLGEEARRVALTLSSNASGPPMRRLQADDPMYGRPGSIRIDGWVADWIAVTHPGNRSPSWEQARAGWREWVIGMRRNGIG